MIRVWEENDSDGRQWLCSQDNQRYIATLNYGPTTAHDEAVAKHRKYIEAKIEASSNKRN